MEVGGGAQGEPGSGKHTHDGGNGVSALHVRFPLRASVPSDGHESGLEPASRIPAGNANDADLRSGDALDTRPPRAPWRSIGDHVEDEVPGRPQAAMRAAKGSQQILAGERIVERIEVAGDEIDRLGELERPEVLKQEASAVPVVLGDGHPQHLCRAIDSINDRHASLAQVADKGAGVAGPIGRRREADTVVVRMRGVAVAVSKGRRDDVGQERRSLPEPDGEDPSPDGPRHRCRPCSDVHRR